MYKTQHEHILSLHSYIFVTKLNVDFDVNVSLPQFCIAESPGIFKAKYNLRTRPDQWTKGRLVRGYKR